MTIADVVEKGAEKVEADDGRAIEWKQGIRGICPAGCWVQVGLDEGKLVDIKAQPKGVAVSSASDVLFPFGSPITMGVGALCYVCFAMIAPGYACERPNGENCPPECYMGRATMDVDAAV